MTKTAKVYERRLREEVNAERKKADTAPGNTHTSPQRTTLNVKTTAAQHDEGRKANHSTPSLCKDHPCKRLCGANEKRQKVLHAHIRQEYLDLVEQLRRTDVGKTIYARRKETIERVFANTKEKYGTHYTYHRGPARFTS